MKRFGLSLVLSVFCCLTINANIHAANRLLYENFDDMSLDDTALSTRDGYTYTWATGRSGSGYCWYSRTTDDPDNTLMWNNPGQWPTDEFYVSYWMRYPVFKWDPASGDIGLKIFYPHWAGTNSYVHFGATDRKTLYYSAKAEGTMIDSGKWIGVGGDMFDGNWHRYEWWVKFSTGEMKFWFDGNLRRHYTYGPGKWNNKKIYYFAGPSIYQKSGTVFSRQIDDYEIWDGMPSGSTSTTSSSSTTSSTSSTSTTAPPPPGKPYVLD